jgi:hypothetical protein
MSSWGNLDNVAIRGNVIIAVANTVNVLGIGTEFTSNLKSGDYVTIASNKYQVNVITSDTVMTLTDAAATNSVGANVFVQQGPKYIANVAFPANNYSIQNIYGIDRVEVGVPENEARGISHTGWTHYTTYTDAYSQTRHKSEVLVAMSKNFSSNATGELFGSGAGVDALDDTVAADFLIFFTVQPTANVTNANTSLFFCATDSDPTGATITFQWQQDNGTGFVNVTNGDSGLHQNITFAGATTNTLSLSNVTSAVNGFDYRVVISGDGGADSNTSDSANLTAP